MATRQTRIRRLTIAAVVIATTAWAANPSSKRAVAGPRIILFYSGVLGEERIFLTDVYENLGFMLAISSAVDTVPPDYRDGPFVDIAMYWHNPTWEPYARDTTLLHSLRPEQGQKSRLYLARQGFRAFVEFPVYIKHRAVDSIGIEILRRHGVPFSTRRSGDTRFGAVNHLEIAGDSIPQELGSCQAVTSLPACW